MTRLFSALAQLAIIVGFVYLVVGLPLPVWAGIMGVLYLVGQHFKDQP